MNINKAARPHVKGETRNLIGVAYIVQGIFQKLADFLNGHNSKSFSRNQLKLST